MSSTGHDDPPEDEGASSQGEPNRARQLFGHKSGASPWEKVGEKVERPVSASAEPPPVSPARTASAPYPRDAQYTPRNPVAEAPEPQAIAPLIPDDVDDDGELTRLHPNYRLVMRIGAVFAGLALTVVSIVVETALRDNFDIPTGIIMIPALVVALYIAIRIPNARFNARGYQISRDRLRVVRGVMWRSDTVVPFGRVQHIDVDQGPLERALNIATMTLHTAGSHNASVSLPGLGHELAVQMREEIRAHIKRETL